MTIQAGIGKDHGPGPLPTLGDLQSLRDSAALTSAWVESAIVNVADARRITLFIAIDGVTSESSAQAGFNVWLSGQKAAPLVGDDVWYAPGSLDIASTDETLSGNRPTGFDATNVPIFRRYVVGPMTFRSNILSASTNKIRFALPLDITGAKWLHVQCIELGDTAHPSVMGINYTLSL